MEQQLITQNIAIACDHAGPELKAALKTELESMGATMLDLGTDTPDSVDYPDYGHKLAEAIKKGQAEMGVLICGSGVGISIAANRHKEIRAALCHNAEVATLSRQHNDANVLCIGARMTDEAMAKAMIHAFFTTAFEGGRHARRVEKLG